MKELIDSMGVWGVPTIVISFAIGIFIFMQLTGEIVEWCGKTAPVWLKVRKIFTARKERIRRLENALVKSNEVLEQINTHYNPESINKRNQWMNRVNDDLTWMHQRAEVYDSSIDRLTIALNGNTKMTEGMFVEDSRDRIINFANMVANTQNIVSREQFRRIYRIYDEYEAFLVEHNRSNGEVDRSKLTIDRAYEYRQNNGCFAEDLNHFIQVPNAD